MPHRLLTILLLTATAQARQVNILWDPAPVAEQVVGWRVYNKGTLIASSSIPSVTLTLTNDAAALTVAAVNAAGESPPSAPLEIPPPMLWIQKSTDLQTWENVIQVPYVPSQFIRLQLPPTP